MEQLQLPLFAFDDTPADRNAQQLVVIREYMHVWTEVERMRRIAGIKNPERDCLGNAGESRLTGGRKW